MFAQTCVNTLVPSHILRGVVLQSPLVFCSPCPTHFYARIQLNGARYSDNLAPPCNNVITVRFNEGLKVNPTSRARMGLAARLPN